jgi:hypothetical protein
MHAFDRHALFDDGLSSTKPVTGRVVIENWWSHFILPVLADIVASIGIQVNEWRPL